MEEMDNVEFLPENETDSNLSIDIPETEPETEPDTESESEVENTELDPEEPLEKIEQVEHLQDSEPEQDNTITVSGNVIILPDGYESVETQAYTSEDIIVVIESIENQTDIIRGGMIGLAFLLGIIGGILLIQGFRLRRV